MRPYGATEVDYERLAADQDMDEAGYIASGHLPNTVFYGYHGHNLKTGNEFSRKLLTCTSLDEIV